MPTFKFVSQRLQFIPHITNYERLISFKFYIFVYFFKLPVTGKKLTFNDYMRWFSYILGFYSTKMSILITFCGNLKFSKNLFLKNFLHISTFLSKPPIITSYTTALLHTTTAFTEYRKRLYKHRKRALEQISIQYYNPNWRTFPFKSARDTCEFIHIRL